MKLSGVLITLNEEKHIADALKSLSFCDEVVVLDAESRDWTREIAQSLGAKVSIRRFTDFASQKNEAIQKARGEWVLLIDADERVTQGLADEILKAIQTDKADGFFLKRKNQIFGIWMRFGINRNDFQLRLVKKEKALFQGAVHERIILSGGTRRLKNPLLHYSTRDVADYMRKINLYTDLEANRRSANAVKLTTGFIVAKSALYFFYTTFVFGGILDGLRGWFFCILGGYYKFISLAKSWELTQDGRR